jgi:predicted  nucleic acid-binding Zn-ribbon protein
MENTGLHRGLELRLEALAKRIATLRRKMKQAKSAEKIEEVGEIEELERRYNVLTGRLAALNREGPGFRQDVKAELEKVADDLSDVVEDFVMWVDSEFQGRRPRMP